MKYIENTSGHYCTATTVLYTTVQYRYYSIIYYSTIYYTVTDCRVGTLALIQIIIV